MKLARKSNNRKKVIVTSLGLVLLVILGWLYYAHHFQKWPFLPSQSTNTATKPTNTVDYGTSSDEQTKAGTATKEQMAEAAKNKNSTDTSSASNSSNQSTVAMEITATNQTSEVFMIRTIIQKVTSTGSCTLTMTGANNKTYTATSNVHAMASTSTCQGFNVPMSNLSSGKWKATVSFKDDTSVGTVTKEDISL